MTRRSLAEARTQRSMASIEMVMLVEGEIRPPSGEDAPPGDGFIASVAALLPVGVPAAVGEWLF